MGEAMSGHLHFRRIDRGSRGHEQRLAIGAAERCVGAPLCSVDKSVFGHSFSLREGVQEFEFPLDKVLDTVDRENDAETSEDSGVGITAASPYTVEVEVNTSSGTSCLRIASRTR